MNATGALRARRADVWRAQIYGASQRYAASQPVARAVAVRRAEPIGSPAPAPIAASSPDGPYTLDSGDKLRIVVFGQDALSNNYIVDAEGAVNLPLIGAVQARGRTTSQLCRRDRRALAPGLHPRPQRGGRDRDLPAVLRARRGHLSRPVPLCAEHDGRRTPSPSPAASRRAPPRTRSPSPARCRACRPAPCCRCAIRSAPATPSKSPNAGLIPAAPAVDTVGDRSAEKKQSAARWVPPRGRFAQRHCPVCSGSCWATLGMGR